MKSEIALPRSFALTGLTRLTVLVGCALAITAMGWPQWLTGTLVNALLLLSVEWAGLGSAMLVGMVTPIGAATSGVLPLPLLVMIPFIAMANATLVGVYDALRRWNRLAALIVAAVAKFALLYAAVTLLVIRPLALATATGAQVIKLPATIVSMMQWPQLATALAGGALAFGVGWSIRRLAR